MFGIQPAVGNGFEAPDKDTIALPRGRVAERVEKIVHRLGGCLLQRPRLFAQLAQDGRAFRHFQQGKASQTIHRRALG